MKKQIRIGAVSYLNTKPLVRGLQPQVDSCRLEFDLPSRLADRLAAGGLDVALIPSIEVRSNPDYRIVSDSCIACRGPVWSVRLLSCVPVDKIRTVALDEGSRTSVVLTRIMLRELGVQPEYSVLPAGCQPEVAGTDAALVIGDRAMKSAKGKFAENAIDLGEWWTTHTGEPFVFAVWTARPELDARQLNRVSDLLAHARDTGLRQLQAISDEESARHGLTAEQCYRYLSTNLHFRLGSPEKRSLRRFWQLADELEEKVSIQTVKFHDYQAVG